VEGPNGSPRGDEKRWKVACVNNPGKASIKRNLLPERVRDNTALAIEQNGGLPRISSSMIR